MNIPKDYDLTHQWQLFCQRSGIPESKMPPDQRREMKRAFFGACGQMLILQRDELSEYADKNGDDAAADVLQNMLNQVEKFWQQEVQNQFGKKN